MRLNVPIKGVLSLSLYISAMSGSPPLVMRLVSSAYSVAEKAGAIVRKVLHSGELGIVEKVGPFLFLVLQSQRRLNVHLAH